MRDAIADVVKQTIGLTSVIKVTGTPDDTRIQGMDEDKTVFVDAHLRTAIPELQGTFGMMNLSLLRGLLDFSTYRTEKATFNVRRRELNGAETVEQFEFRDGCGAGADYRCMSGELVPEQAEIKNVSWDITVDPNPAKIAEFQQLSSLYAEVDKNFGVKNENGNLLFFFGDENSSIHRASMVFETGIGATLTAGLQWSASQFLQVLKLAGAERRIRITGRGVLCVEAETAFGSYKYYLRATR